MNRSGLLIFSTIATLVLAVTATGAVAQQKSLKDQLVGSWALVSTEVTETDGKKRQDFGPNPKGILILDASGRYALVQSKVDRPKFKTTGNVRLETPAAEYGEAARAFAANFGTWSVNEGDKTLIRKYEGSLIPNVETQETKVTVSLTGDELKLVGTSPAGVRTDTVYRRAK
jgi:hypothetical protein